MSVADPLTEFKQAEDGFGWTRLAARAGGVDGKLGCLPEELTHGRQWADAGSPMTLKLASSPRRKARVVQETGPRGVHLTQFEESQRTKEGVRAVRHAAELLQRFLRPSSGVENAGQIPSNDR